MTMDRLQERKAKAEENVLKCKKTIERHEKQLVKKIELGDDYDIRSKKSDIEGATVKLRDAEKILNNWNEKIGKEEEKERFLEDNAPQAIRDFLEQWKEKAILWHNEKFIRYQDFKTKLMEEKLSYEEQSEGMDYLERRKFLEENGVDSRSIGGRKQSFAGTNVMYMDTLYDEEERSIWLEGRLEKEKKVKMLDLVERIYGYIGIIEDASMLNVSPKGNLDGLVTGVNGTVEVKTIGAGGYNIQCFHFRTLINRVN